MGFCYNSTKNSGFYYVFVHTIVYISTTFLLFGNYCILLISKDIWIGVGYNPPLLLSMNYYARVL